MRRLLSAASLLVVGLLIGACTRQPPPAGQSHLTLPSMCDPTPYYRVEQDDKDYIDDLPR